MDEKIKRIDLTGALPDEPGYTSRLGDTTGSLGTGAPGGPMGSGTAGTIGGGGLDINLSAGLDGPNASNLDRAGGGHGGDVMRVPEKDYAPGCDEYCEDETIEGNRTVRADEAA